MWKLTFFLMIQMNCFYKTEADSRTLRNSCVVTKVGEVREVVNEVGIYTYM